MRILIITDLEGISRVRTFEQIQKGSPDLAYSNERLAADTNACIRACFDGGADRLPIKDDIAF